MDASDLIAISLDNKRPQCLRVNKFLFSGQKEEIDFRDYEIDGEKFTPQGVIIDCTDSDGDAVVLIRPLGFKAVCSKGSIVQVPYPAAHGQLVELMGEGKTNFFFVNYTIFPSSGGSMSASGVQAIIPGSGINVDSSNPSAPVISATGGGGAGGGFEGFIGLFVAQSTAVDVEVPTTYYQATYDANSWVQAGSVVVPDGVTGISVDVNSTAYGDTKSPETRLVLTINGSGVAQFIIGETISNNNMLSNFPFIEVMPGDVLGFNTKSSESITVGMFNATFNVLRKV